MMDREEALRIVRENYPHFGTTEPLLDLEKALATLIPELRESEDERMIKWLIKVLDEGYKAFFEMDYSKEDVLSWLEKQKEQKPAWSEVEFLFRGEKVTVKRPFYRDDKGRGYSTAELDEDVAWNALRAWCEKKGISLYDLYPKAEWSEEDYHWEGLVQLLRDYQKTIDRNSNNMAYEDVERYIGWVNSLRPQPKQEWSEEDEAILDSLIRLYSKEYVGEIWPWANGAFTYGDVVNFLKSLRPSWKPSEEQMKELLNALTPGKDFDCDVLFELYEQLKKL